jgi:hypothetical protein
MKLKLTLFLAAGLFLQACGYKLPESSSGANASSNSANRNAGNAQNSNANVSSAIENSNKSVSNNESADSQTPLILSGGEGTNFPCNGREVEIEESTTANNYIFTGECKKLTVDGVSNTVNVEKVGEIVVKGTSNKVIYGEGISGKKPKISKSGVSTFAGTKAEAEKQAAKNQMQ